MKNELIHFFQRKLTNVEGGHVWPKKDNLGIVGTIFHNGLFLFCLFRASDELDSVPGLAFRC